jgi:hypothetical protein
MTDYEAGSGRAGGVDDFFLPNHEPRRRRGLRVVTIVLASLVVLLVILAVAVELVARGYAENRAEKQIESSLPSGTTGTVSVSMHGFSVILQALSGSLDDVTLTSHDLVVKKVPLSFTADLRRVPLHSGATTGPVTGSVHLDQQALNKSSLLTEAHGTVVLGRGTVAYDSDISILGLDLDYKLTAKPSVSPDGKSLLLTPTAVAIRTPTASFSTDALLGYLKANPVSICAAQSLPSSVRVTKVSVDPGDLTLDLRSAGLPLSSAGLSTTGSC